ncbi:rRNA methyltransferase 3B, mitochondrial [Triplophysa rosa]|uniref:Rnmtl1-b protein n=1 Tax=Triplophysa rosa TaxID=992332 RepID=A0A9W7TFA6_TRIRA|nr:rRNA methyltransferase 3B, mitochondrial [Triplophysa rosa]KAI7795884.1 Rnmtl1-b protein [Triplophysa rosa]
MAMRVASMRCLSPIFQSVLTSRCNVTYIKRYVRRRRPVSLLTSNNEPTENAEQVSKVSQFNERLLNENIHRSPEKARWGSESVTSVSQKHDNNPESVQFSGSSRGIVMNATTLPRYGEVDGLLYDKSRPGDKSLMRLVNIARSKKLREHQGKVILEGGHLIRCALDAGAVAQNVFFSSVKALRELPLDNLRRASLVKVKMEDTKFWSDLDTSQDVIAIFKRPVVSRLTFPEEKFGRPLPLTLICDNVRDPGNLGAVLRSAAAAGCHSVLLTKGCVDVWEPKVLRAAMGAHFRLPIIPNLTWSDIPDQLPTTATIHVADNCGTTTNEDEPGVTAQNKRKPRDYGWVRGHQNPMKVQCDDDGDSEDYEGSRCAHTSKSLDTLYYHTDWVARHTGLVIGGETHGLSQEALRLAERTGGRRLLIPMVCDVDSLNSAMAASILLFEGRRQLQLQIRGKLTEMTAS